jgi:hypothetical protein
MRSWRFLKRHQLVLPVAGELADPFDIDEPTKEGFYELPPAA